MGFCWATVILQWAQQGVYWVSAGADLVACGWRERAVGVVPNEVTAVGSERTDAIRPAAGGAVASYNGAFQLGQASHLVDAPTRATSTAGAAGTSRAADGVGRQASHQNND